MGIIKTLFAIQKEVEVRLREIAEEDEEVKILKTVPGIDDLNASRLVSEIGNIERFSTDCSRFKTRGASAIFFKATPVPP
jgi:hypothetical protein